MLVRKVEKFIAVHRMPRTRFGRLAAQDPRLVDDLRNGREPRPALAKRVEHFMNTYRSNTHVA